MTVRELIERLEQIENKDLEVIGYGRDDVDDVTDVKIDTWYYKGIGIKKCEIHLGDY